MRAWAACACGYAPRLRCAHFSCSPLRRAGLCADVPRTMSSRGSAQVVKARSVNNGVGPSPPDAEGLHSWVGFGESSRRARPSLGCVRPTSGRKRPHRKWKGGAPAHHPGERRPCRARVGLNLSRRTQATSVELHPREPGVGRASSSLPLSAAPAHCRRLRRGRQQRAEGASPIQVGSDRWRGECGDEWEKRKTKELRPGDFRAGFAKIGLRLAKIGQWRAPRADAMLPMSE